MTTVPKETLWCWTCKARPGAECLAAASGHVVEPETLQAWAERTVPTLDDDDFAELPKLARGSGEIADKTRALLAVLDRIAGELSSSMRDFFGRLRCQAPAPEYVRWMHARRLLAFEGSYNYVSYSVTPLGKAVLARTEGRR